MTRFWRKGHYRNGSWIDGHFVCRDDWDRFSLNFSLSSISYKIEQTIFSSFVIPNAICPICGARVFYYENNYGSKVWFDDLGSPWPKHGCFEKNILPKEIYTSHQTRPLYKGNPCLIKKILLRGNKAYVQALTFSPQTGEENLYFIAPGILFNQLKICYFLESKTSPTLEFFDIENNREIRVNIQIIRNQYDLLLLAKIRYDNPQLIYALKRWRQMVSIKNPTYYYKDGKSICIEEKMSAKDKISLFLWLSKNSNWDLENILYFSGLSEYERMQIGNLKINPEERSVEELGLIDIQMFNLIKNNVNCLRKVIQ